MMSYTFFLHVRAASDFCSQCIENFLIISINQVTWSGPLRIITQLIVVKFNLYEERGHIYIRTVINIHKTTAKAQTAECKLLNNLEAMWNRNCFCFQLELSTTNIFVMGSAVHCSILWDFIKVYFGNKCVFQTFIFNFFSTSSSVSCRVNLSVESIQYASCDF